MTTGRFRLFAVAALIAPILLGGIVGCAQSGPIAARRNTVGSLKASVSQLEYANENLKKQVADLKSDSTRYANQLDEEKNVNGELTARLDDAKDVIRKQGIDVTALNRGSGSASKASTASNGDDDLPSPTKSSPVSRARGGRKAPITKINKAKSVLDNDPGSLELPDDRYDPGPQAARDDDDGRWLPVARGRSRGGSVELR